MAPFLERISLETPSFLMGLVTGIFLYFLYNLSKCSKSVNEGSGKDKREFSIAEDFGETKMVLVVRNDLKMGKGKAAAQCSHAAVMAHEVAAKMKPDLLKKWKQRGQRKIVVKTESEGELLQLEGEARKLGLVSAIVKDAGLTQIASGTRTVLAVGPGPESLIDKVTNHLKLY